MMRQRAAEVTAGRGMMRAMIPRGAVRAACVDWLAFAAAHASIVLHLRWFGDSAFGDLYLYHWWMRHAPTPVLEADWVYPVLALIPMALPGWIESADAYVYAWLAMVTAVNAVVFAVVRRRRPGGRVAALWWCVFIALLGPVALARLDALASAAAILAVGWVVTRPVAASALLAVAAWIKVAHGFWLPILFAALRSRWRQVVMPAAVVSAVVVSASLIAGSGARVFSFGFQQSERGLQVEAALAAPFHLARLAGADYRPEYNQALGTNEFDQAWPSAVAGVADLLLVGAVLALSFMVWRAVRRCPDRTEPIVLASLIGVTAALLLFNKVGSPQLYLWLAAPIMAVLVVREPRFSKRTIAWLAGAGLFVAAVSQAIFPLFYQEFLRGEAWIVIAYGARTLVLGGLLLWSLVTIAGHPDESSSSEALDRASS